MITKTSYCGIGCENCSISEGEITESVDTLVTIMKESGLFYNLKNLEDKVPAFKYENEFYTFLNELVRVFGSCNGCKSKELMEICQVKTCAEEKKINICSECKDKQTCEKIQDKPWLF
ncbi:MAG: DUF3795 domain-containing protein [Candidatus Thorarchaeota archaeon]